MNVAMMESPRNEQEAEALLAYRTENVAGLERAIAIKHWHWSLVHVIRPGARVEAEVGKRLQLVCRFHGIVEWSVVRRPSGAQASMNANAFTPDRAGLYVARVSIHGFSRDVEVCCVPTALLDKIGAPAGVNDRCKTLRCRLNDGRTTEDIINALEGTNGWGTLASPAH